MSFLDLCGVYTGTTGTGTLTLGSAIPGLLTLSGASAVDATVYDYSIANGSDREVGYGTYTAAGPTLTRNLVKSTTGSLLNLTGTSEVRMTPRAASLGDVVGPASSTDNTLPRYHLTTGKIIQGSGIVVDDSNNVSSMGTLGCGAITSSGEVKGDTVAINDSDDSHKLAITTSSNLSANRTLTLIPGDADRSLTIGANSSISGTAYVSGGTDVAIADGGTGASDAATAFAALKQPASTTASGVSEFATTAEYQIGTDTGRSLVVDQVWASGALTALTSGTNIAVDMATGFNFSLSIAHNATLSNPTNTKVGQTGAIAITQTAGSNMLAYGTNWEFAGGVAPVLSTAASAKDILFYWVQSSTSIIVTGVLKAVA